MTFRIIHRYLGFFLAGIMAVYAVSGIIMIFRDTSFLKKETIIRKEIRVNLDPAELGPLLGIRGFEVLKEEGDLIYFEKGFYNQSTGHVEYPVTTLPTLVNQLTGLHKAKSGDPLFLLNIFFGISLLFFVISAFWMFAPKTSVFRKGLYFTAGGIVLMLLLLLT